jgi:hypothetical protein
VGDHGEHVEHELFCGVSVEHGPLLMPGFRIGLRMKSYGEVA